MQLSEINLQKNRGALQIRKKKPQLQRVAVLLFTKFLIVTMVKSIKTQVNLTSDVYSPSFSNHGNLYLAWVGHVCLYFLRNLKG